MRIREYLAAARQIENLICTSRESLLGSSAWRPDFLAALKSRPFYFVTEVSRGEEMRGEERRGDVIERRIERPARDTVMLHIDIVFLYTISVF
jgi:Domain of unknown function (DUF4211)